MSSNHVTVDEQSVAANTQTANLLSGTALEFMKRPYKLVIAATASAIGLKMTLIVGDEIQVDDQSIPVATTFPEADKHAVFDSGAAPGDRIVLRFRNSTGAAITLRGALVKAIPL